MSIVMEKNEFQNRVFLFSNFLGVAILNNRDVSWLLYCSDTKSFCLITKGQPFRARHNYSRWRRPGTLKTKINDSIIHVFKVNALC